MMPNNLPLSEKTEQNGSTKASTDKEKNLIKKEENGKANKKLKKVKSKISNKSKILSRINNKIEDGLKSDASPNNALQETTLKEGYQPGYINKSNRTITKLGSNISTQHSLGLESHSTDAHLNEEHAETDANGNNREASVPQQKQSKNIANKLQDSKSNRALQSINPEASYNNSKLRNRRVAVAAKSPNENCHKLIKNNTKKAPNPKKMNKTVNKTVNKKSLVTTITGANKVNKHTSESTKSKLLASETNDYVRRNQTKDFPGVMETLDDSESVEDNEQNIKEKAPTPDIVQSNHATPTNTDCQSKKSDMESSKGESSPIERDKSKTPIKQLSPCPPPQRNSVATMRSKSERETLKITSPRPIPDLCRNHPSKNPDEILEAVLFCSICRDSVCYKCAFERHKEHDVAPIQTAADNIRVKLSECKRKIEANISHLRSQRKSAEANSDDVSKRMQVQFSAVMERIREKEQEVIMALESARQQSLNAVYKLQTQQETAWNQIDAVLKTQEDSKMLQEYRMLDTATTCVEFSPCTSTDSGCMSPALVSPRATLNLHDLQAEIEKISLQCSEAEPKRCEGNKRPIATGLGDNNIYSNLHHKYCFKFDPLSANPALRISANGTCVEYLGSERSSPLKANKFNEGISGASNKAPRLSPNHPFLQGASVSKWRKTQFSSVLADAPITQGKQYWEVSVNRSMEYKLGVTYKHIQGTKTLPDGHNSWLLSLSYPDRFSALHKGRKEYIFISGHANLRNIKILRIGLFLDYERGILSFYNATNSAEKRHLYTFRTFFNRPLWPIVSLRQGKLQIITGVPVPRNLVWKTR